MIEAYKKFWSNYANFKNRSTRSDYWYLVLANMLVGFIMGFACGFIDGISGSNLGLTIPVIYFIAVIVPSIAIVVRRLHDINKSGWYYFVNLIPMVGPAILLVYLCTASVNENNNYGKQV